MSFVSKPVCQLGVKPRAFILLLLATFIQTLTGSLHFLVFICKGQVIHTTFSCSLPRNNVALQGMYHLRAQQILMLQKVEATCTFCNTKI